jgi:hypothetical protein
MDLLPLSTLSDPDGDNNYSSQFMKAANEETLSEFAAYLSTNSATSGSFWTTLSSYSKRSTKHIDQALVHHLWHLMLTAEEATALQAGLCYARLLSIPGSTAHGIFQQQIFLCVIDACSPPDAPLKRKRRGKRTSAHAHSSSSAAAAAASYGVVRTELLCQLLSMLPTFPLKNYHAAKDAIVDLLTTLIQKCTGWSDWTEECGPVTRQGMLRLLHVQHGTPMSTAVSLLLRLVPTLVGASVPQTASSISSSVGVSHKEAKTIVVSILKQIKQQHAQHTQHPNSNKGGSKNNDNAQDQEAQEHNVDVDPTTTMPTSASTTSTTTGPSLSLAKAVIKRICEQAPERALPRTLAMDAVMYITKHCLPQQSEKSNMYTMLAKFTRSKKTSIRLFAVDVCVALLVDVSASSLESGIVSPNEFLSGSNVLFSAISARLEDKTPKLRSRALKGLADVLRTDGQAMETPIVRSILDLFINAEGQLNMRLIRRIEDDSSSVRKESCRIL